MKNNYFNVGPLFSDLFCFIIIVHYVIQKWQYNLYSIYRLDLGSSRVIFSFFRCPLHFCVLFFLLHAIWLLNKLKNGRDSNRGPPGCLESTLSIRPRQPTNKFSFSTSIVSLTTSTPSGYSHH